MNYYVPSEVMVKLEECGNRIIKDTLGKEANVALYSQKDPNNILVIVKLYGEFNFYSEIYREIVHANVIRMDPETFFREVTLYAALGI
jgi:hypothetical protein